jgi:hypothetical protein
MRKLLKNLGYKIRASKNVHQVAHLLVGGEVAAAAVVVDDHALQRLRLAAGDTLAASAYGIDELNTKTGNVSDVCAYICDVC